MSKARDLADLPQGDGDLTVDGNVGIGTSNPEAKLEVAGNIGFGTGGTFAAGQLYSDSNWGAILRAKQASPSVAEFAFQNADGTERIRIDSSGNVGIGTISPANKLDVQGGSNLAARIWSTGGTIGNYAELKLNAYNDFSGQSQSYIRAVSTASGNSGTALTFATEDNGFGGAVERMRIDNSGNVGIGTISPANGKLVVENNGSNIYLKQTTGDYGHIIGQNDADGALTFSRRNGSNTERMRIDSSGNLLLNNTDVGNYRLKIKYNGGGEEGIGLQSSYSGAGNMLRFLNSAGTTVGLVSTNNTSTTYSTSSDYRLKEDWQPMVSNLDRVSALKPVNFAWKVDGSRVDGFLAHELAEVVPEAVTGTKDAMRTEEYEKKPAVYKDVVIPAVLDDDGNEIEAERTESQLVSKAVMGEREVPDYQAIDQSKLVPLLTAALQDAVKEIEALKKRIEALEG